MRARNFISSSLPQIGRVGITSKFLLHLFCVVGRQALAVFPAKTFTLGGTFASQILFYSDRDLSRDVLEAWYSAVVGKSPTYKHF
jgi:hypothetical protein